MMRSVKATPCWTQIYDECGMRGFFFLLFGSVRDALLCSKKGRRSEDANNGTLLIQMHKAGIKTYLGYGFFIHGKQSSLLVLILFVTSSHAFL